MRFAIKTSPQHTTWDDMLDVWQAADDIDLFESAWTFDHFYPIFSDPTGPCLEGWTTLTALAQATRRLRVGVLVTGNVYRHPAVLANMAATRRHHLRRPARARARRRLERGGVRRLRHRPAAAEGALRPLRRGVRGDRRPAVERDDRLRRPPLPADARPAASRSRCSGRTRRSASAARARSARCGPSPAGRSTGTTPARPGRARQQARGARGPLRRHRPRPVGDHDLDPPPARRRRRPGPVVEQAAALAEAGLDLGIVYLPAPHTPRSSSRSPPRSRR